MFQAVEKDENYKAIIDAIQRDIDFDDLAKDHPGKEYGKKAWDQLGILDDQPNTLVVYDSNKVVVPKQERRNIIKTL